VIVYVANTVELLPCKYLYWHFTKSCYRTYYCVWRRGIL